MKTMKAVYKTLGYHKTSQSTPNRHPRKTPNRNEMYLKKLQEFPGSPQDWESMLLLLRVQVQSLVRELIAHKLHGVARKKKRERK